MTSKIARKTVDLGYGIKVTVERPYGPQDAIEEFKAAIEKVGGKVAQVHDEIIVTADPTMLDAVNAATKKLTEDLSGLGAAATPRPARPRVYSDFEARLADIMLGGPFGFPSFAHLSPTGRHPTGPEPQNLKQAPKLKPAVAKVAPKALSTWEFTQQPIERLRGTAVHLVGQHYRSKADQEVLGYKRVGNMALLVAEPDNPVDLNAVMVLMWDDLAKEWHHVGYVRATEAMLLRGRWTGDYRNAMVARITSIPANADGHRNGRNIVLTLTGEVRTYPGYNALMR